MVGEPSNALPMVRGERPGAFALSYALLRQLADIPVRKAWSIAGRRRMEAIRRDPAPLLDKLRGAGTVLFVCHGNIIRSAFAAQALRRRLGPSSRVDVKSAGVDACPGREAHPLALELARAMRVDLSRHAASRLSAELVDDADVIFVADLLQLTAVRRQFPQARAKTFLFSCLAPATPLEVRDPIDGGERGFAACFDHILAAIEPIAGALMSPHRPCEA